MKTIYTLLIVLFGSLLFGQEYRPLLGQNNFWEVLHINSIGDGLYNTVEIQYKLDDQIILINEKDYTPILFRNRISENGFPFSEWSGWATSMYLHEDIEEKRVYVYYDDSTYSDHDHGEFLLYDFSLDVDDQIPTEGAILGQDYIVTITSIGTENILGLENVKTFYTDGIGFDGDNLKIYEGIGASTGLNTLTSELDYIFNLVNFSTTLTVIENNCSKTKIYPNPFKDKIQIQNSEEIKEIQLLDSQGKLISTSQNVDGLNSKLGSLNNGVYFLRIQTQNNQTETIKLIKNK